LPQGSSTVIITELEPYYIDTVLRYLNVDSVGGLKGKHEPMSQETRDKLRKERGIVVYMYNIAVKNYYIYFFLRPNFIVLLILILERLQSMLIAETDLWIGLYSVIIFYKFTIIIRFFLLKT
jgi:hypothetical protein